MNEPDPDTKFIFVTGNPKDGFKHIGPFPSHEEVMAYSDSNDLDFDWWIVELEKP